MRIAGALNPMPALALLLQLGQNVLFDASPLPTRPLPLLPLLVLHWALDILPPITGETLGFHDVRRRCRLFESAVLARREETHPGEEPTDL